MEGIFKKDKSGSGGGGETKEVALLSITTAPTGTFAVGSKYYNSTDKKIYTSVVADSWDGATVEAPQFGAYYLYNNTTYVWDGNSLEEYELENFVKKTDIVDNLTTDNANKVLSANQGKVLKQEVDTKNPILEVDNTINENSYNVVSNKAIAEGIKANTTTVVNDVVDVLPTADTLDKKVLLTTDNKIYKTVKEKEINSAFIVTGNLAIDSSKGNISGFSDTNYLTLISQFWVQLFPVKLRVVFNMTLSIDVPFLQIYKNDTYSLLFSLSAYSGVASNDHRFVAKVYDSDGNVIESKSFSFTENFGNSVFDIKILMNRIDISKEGTFITSLFLSKLNTSLIPYNVAGTLKLSNIISGGYSKGIYYIDGLNSSIRAGGFVANEYKLVVDKSGNNFVWQEYLTCQKDSVIMNLPEKNIYCYDGVAWQKIGNPEITDTLGVSNIFSNIESANIDISTQARLVDIKNGKIHNYILSFYAQTQRVFSASASWKLGTLNSALIIGARLTSSSIGELGFGSFYSTNGTNGGQIIAYERANNDIEVFIRTDIDIEQDKGLRCILQFTTLEN